MNERISSGFRQGRFAGIPDGIWSVGFFLLMLSVICFGGSDQGTNYYYYFSFFFFIGYSILLYFLRHRERMRIYLPLHFVWYLLFLLYAIASAIWAESFVYSMLPVSKMVQILGVTYCLVLYVDGEDALERYIRVVIAATLFMMAYVYIKTPASQWFNGFLGAVTRYNTNDVGCALSVCVLFSFFEAYVRKRKWFYCITAVAFLTAILTSSRKALIMCLLGVLLMVVFNYRARNYMLRVLIAIVLLIVALVLVYEIPYLYRTVGVRLDKMIEFIMSDRTVDNSLALRSFYIDMARSYFAESPLIGIGLNNFTYRIHDYGSRLSYAHNNYMEIAADLGVVGLVIYYWFYIYLLFKLGKQVLDGHKNALLFFAMMILFMIFEYGMVNYYKMQVHLIIAAAYVVTVMNDRADRDGREAA